MYGALEMNRALARALDDCGRDWRARVNPLGELVEAERAHRDRLRTLANPFHGMIPDSLERSWRMHESLAASMRSLDSLDRMRRITDGIAEAARSAVSFPDFDRAFSSPAVSPLPLPDPPRLDFPTPPPPVVVVVVVRENADEQGDEGPDDDWENRERISFNPRR